MKNCEEWSVAFDLMYQNITSNQAPGLTEFEKSKFLTMAQDTIVIGLYNGSITDSFEETEELTDYLSSLVSQKDCIEVTAGLQRISSDSQIFKLPDDLLFRTLEICLVDTENCGAVEAAVIPVTQDEYWRTSRNPFKGKGERKVLRLSYSMGSVGYSELISKEHVSRYTVRYLRKPEPIILVDLEEDGFSIEGKTAPCTCQLHEKIHQLILTQAVQLAKAVWAA